MAAQRGWHDPPCAAGPDGGIGDTMFGGRGAGRGQGGEAGERVWAMLVGGGHPDQHDQAVQNPGRGGRELCWELQ